jgi:hypothetical protein
MHPEVLQEIQRASQHFGRRFMIIVGPALIVFFMALLTPILVFGVHAPGWYLVLVLWGWIASIPVGWRYARKRTQAEFNVLGDLPLRCRICDVNIPRKDIPAHDTSEHPRESRYFRLSARVVLGSLFGIVAVLFLYLSAVFLDLVPAVDVDVLRAWVFGTLLAWAGSVALWGTLVDPRLKAKARAEWHSTHFGRQSAKR